MRLSPQILVVEITRALRKTAIGHSHTFLCGADRELEALDSAVSKLDCPPVKRASQDLEMHFIFDELRHILLRGEVIGIVS